MALQNALLIFRSPENKNYPLMYMLQSEYYLSIMEKSKTLFITLRALR